MPHMAPCQRRLATGNYAHSTQWYTSSQLIFKQLRLAGKAITPWFKSGKRVICDCIYGLWSSETTARQSRSGVAMYGPLLSMDGRINLAIYPQMAIHTQTIYPLSEYPLNLISLVHRLKTSNSGGTGALQCHSRFHKGSYCSDRHSGSLKKFIVLLTPWRTSLTPLKKLNDYAMYGTTVELI